ncbi:MAG TPA: hypothetical protein VIR58_13200 [Acidimicrobiales bacterium]
MGADRLTGRGVPSRHFLETSEVFVGAPLVDGALGYWDVDDRQLARIESDEDTPGLLEDFVAGLVLSSPVHAWRISASDGPVFSIGLYEAADDPSFRILSPEGEHLGTYLCDDGVLRDEILVREEATAPVAEVETRRRLHQLRELHGPPMATCKRVLDRVGDDPLQEVWWLQVHDDRDILDRRVLLALPLVCALTGPMKRSVGPDGVVAGTLLLALPPVGLALLLVEGAIDGWYWLRRQLT